MQNDQVTANRKALESRDRHKQLKEQNKKFQKIGITLYK